MPHPAWRSGSEWHAPSSRLELADELKPFEAEASKAVWDDGAERPIVVRGPEVGRYVVVSGVARFVDKWRNALISVLTARDASTRQRGQVHCEARLIRCLRPQSNDPLLLTVF